MAYRITISLPDEYEALMKKAGKARGFDRPATYGCRVIKDAIEVDLKEKKREKAR